MKGFFYELMGEHAEDDEDATNHNDFGARIFDTDERINMFEETASKLEGDRVGFWFFLSLTVLNSFVAVLGNGLVIYAGLRYRNDGRLRYLDGVVKSLALTDLLYASLGVFANYINYYLHQHTGRN